MSREVGDHAPFKIPTSTARTCNYCRANYLSLFLPQARIRDQNAATRATVVAAIRYTFAETAQSYDDLLAPLLFDFLSLMADEDLVCFCSPCILLDLNCI